MPRLTKGESLNYAFGRADNVVMERNRLVDISLGRLNRGLLVFRLGLYTATALGLIQRAAPDQWPWTLTCLGAAAFIPALPGLRRKIELAVATTLLLELGLTFVVGPFPALQILPMFSVAVAGLFLTRRAAATSLAVALGAQAATVLALVSESLPTEIAMSDLIGEAILLVAAGIGFIEMGAILRGYQADLIDGAQEELRLTEMIHAKDQLIDSIAHEIRTPVTAVLGLASELENPDGIDTAGVSEIAAIVASESRRLAHLVDNLVLRSRADIDTLTWHRETVDARGSVLAAWSTLGLTPQGLAIHGDADVIADRRRLEHILVNLFDNSFRHGVLPVTVAIETEPMTARIRVTDEGAGFSRDTERMFRRYESASEPTRPQTFGLGLPVSKTLAERMDGDLRISAEGVELVLSRSVTAVPA